MKKAPCINKHRVQMLIHISLEKSIDIKNLSCYNKDTV